MAEIIPGLVFRPRKDGFYGVLHRWDVTTAQALKTLLDDPSCLFRDEVVNCARGVVRDSADFPSAEIGCVTKKPGNTAYEIEVKLGRVGCSRTKTVVVPASRLSTFGNTELRGILGKPRVKNSTN